ncbi:hypothetical protein [Erwinia oleae]|uniref:hypothetical protein n=1 Tax=Erwinia oleae TaxID=796334 RepID=UPI0005553E55|nr:hypothetical protein [Erwinia oleae]
MSGPCAHQPFAQRGDPLSQHTQLITGRVRHRHPIRRYAGDRYLQPAALLLQENQHEPFIMLRVALPADNAGLLRPLQDLAERAGSWQATPG